MIKISKNKIIIYGCIVLALGYYIKAAQYQYQRRTEISYLLIDKKISKKEHAKLIADNTLLNAMLSPAAVFGFK